MTVAIDPSEVRREAAVKGQLLARGFRLPARTLLLGGLGGAGLLAFTIGAFSFFGGLADPRVRNIRPATIVSKMPDLKDGVPALVSDGKAPAATVLNLPRPPVSDPAPAKAEIASRTDGSGPTEKADPPAPARAAAPAPVRTAAAEATGSVAPKGAASMRAKGNPSIENAPTVLGDAKAAPLIAPARTAGPLAPARAETVRAKPASVAALSEEAQAPMPASKPAEAQAGAAEPRSSPAKKPAQKVARAKAKPAVEASAESAPEAVPASAATADDDGFDAKVGRGIKAIGGLFGQE